MLLVRSFRVFHLVFDCRSDFDSSLHAEYGNCFTLKLNHTFSRPGKKRGLRLLLTVNVSIVLPFHTSMSIQRDDAITGKFDFLPTSTTPSVSVHTTPVCYKSWKQISGLHRSLIGTSLRNSRQELEQRPRCSRILHSIEYVTHFAWIYDYQCCRCHSKGSITRTTTAQPHPM